MCPGAAWSSMPLLPGPAVACSSLARLKPPAPSLPAPLQRSSLALKALLAGQGHASLAAMVRATSNVAGLRLSDVDSGGPRACCTEAAVLALL